jgi:membrane-associated protease RseP (regulator of RpoE activity)
MRIKTTLSSTLLVLLASAALAQHLPPPVARPTPTPKPTPRAPSGPAAPSGGESRPSETKEPPTALLICDLPCDITIDGEPAGSYPAGKPQKLKLQPGQHLMRAANAADACSKEQIVEGKPGQTVLKVDLRATCTTEFDRTMAQLWMAQQDFTLAGSVVERVPAKQFRSATPVDTASLFASHQTLQQQFDKIAALTPADPSRQRIAEEMKRVAENANKYVEVLTQAITEAKSGKEKSGWLGKLLHRKEEASKGLNTTLEWSFDTWSTLKGSPTFAAALPAIRRAELGLGGAPPFDLGIDYYNYQPDVIVFVRKGGRASQAGMKDGDRLVSADGRPVRSLLELGEAAASGASRTMLVRVARGGKEETLRLAVPGGGPGR